MLVREELRNYVWWCSCLRTHLHALPRCAGPRWRFICCHICRVGAPPLAVVRADHRRYVQRLEAVNGVPILAFERALVALARRLPRDAGGPSVDGDVRKVGELQDRALRAQPPSNFEVLDEAEAEEEEEQGAEGAEEERPPGLELRRRNHGHRAACLALPGLAADKNDSAQKDPVNQDLLLLKTTFRALRVVVGAFASAVHLVYRRNAGTKARFLWCVGSSFARAVEAGSDEKRQAQRHTSAEPQHLNVPAPALPQDRKRQWIRRS